MLLMFNSRPKHFHFLNQNFITTKKTNMKKFIKTHPIFYFLTIAFLVCTFCFTCFKLSADSIPAGTITNTQFVKDTATVNLVTNMLKQYLPAQWMPLVTFGSVLAIGLLVLLLHFDVKLFKKAAPVILVLFMLGLNSCSVGKYITSHCSIDPTVTQQSGGSGSVCFTCDSVALLLQQVPANLLLTPKNAAKK